MPEVNDNGADYPSKDDDERDPEPDMFAVDNGSEAGDVTSPRSPRDAAGGSLVSPRVVTPATQVPTPPRRQLRNT